ncbi:hypothetical protein DFQ27_006410 [Actinomortierella ambigua]|uniref:ER membrane protein complex subunit 4 n=1 Tax=Actinomortierella ambigua TaxID=1343610 RepID=A0A9P6PVV4_9FUNG|nr:hypothetical protein DFQ26_000836 [Actinomortierella ambigua]KAG0255141.1 hypothetical protein DFQ27_006410 [Actinomortierella ambigua]
MATKQWKFDFASPDIPRKSVIDPPGYLSSKDVATRAQKKSQSDDDQELLKVKKAWDVALAPGKQLPMQAFMLWMSGNSVQIFSVAITAMLMFSPIRAILNMAQVFDRFESASGVKQSFTESALYLPKITFIAMQLLSILLGMWKLNSMGLLPTSHSDWLAFQDPKTPIEFASM